MKNDAEMELKDHVREMRNRLLVCIVIFLAVFGVSMYKANNLLSLFLSLTNGTDIKRQFAFLYPQEVFIQYLSISALVGVIVTIPVILYEVGMFVAPAVDNKLPFFLFIISAGILFYIGMAFCIFVMLPFVMNYFSTINAQVSATGMISIEKYMSLIKTMILSFGFVFEIPVIVTVLSKVGILTPERMLKFRNPYIVLSFLVSAIITPPDVTSQIIVAVPMVILYQISYVICKKCINGKTVECEE